MNGVEFTISPRFKTIAIDNVEFKGKKCLSKMQRGGELEKAMQGLFEWALADEEGKQMVESRKLYLRTLAMKALNNWLMRGAKEIINANVRQGLIKQALNKVNITGGGGVGLELVEERLFRLLKAGVETGLKLDDLEALSATVRNNELEVVFGKDFSNMKYLIYSGYNLEKVGKELFEVVSWQDDVVKEQN